MKNPIDGILRKNVKYSFEFEVLSADEKTLEPFLRLIFSETHQAEMGIKGIKFAWDNKEEFYKELLEPIKRAVIEGKL